MATATLTQTLENMTVAATATAVPARLYNLTGRITNFGGAIICFIGPPHKSLEWRLLDGNGTITPFTTFTDALGRSACRYDPEGLSGHAVIAAAFIP